MKTQFSRRELYSLGEPLGESATHAVAGRRIYGGGGGGGGPIQTLPAQIGPTNPIQSGGSNTSFSNTSSTPQTPSGVNPMSQTDTQQGIAGYAQPYVNSMLGATMQNLFNYDQNGNATGMKQYNPYSYNPADYVAGFSPLQQQAQNGIAGLQAPAQGQQAADYANRAIQGLMGQQYNPQTGGYMSVDGAQTNAASAGGAPTNQAAQFQGPDKLGYQSVSNQGLNNYQMGPAQQVGAQNFGGQSAQDYMNPYMQNVVDIQQREAQRQADIAGTQRGANAAKSGAFGGSRQAIMDAEAARNLATQKGDIQAQGLNSAYTNAQQQFNADQARQMAAQQSNQQAGLTTGQNNLSALLGVQSLGAGQNLQSQLANQQAGIQTGQANQNMQYNTGLQNAQLAQQSGLANQALQGQYGLANAGYQQQANLQNAQQQQQANLANQSASQQAQNLAAQQQQFGANYGMQGLQSALSGANTLGNLGTTNLNNQLGILNAQNAAGNAQQQQQQNIINQGVSNYNTAQQYPMTQLNQMKGILSGLPVGTTSSQQYQAAPTNLQNLLALGMGGAGISQLLGGGGSGGTGGGGLNISNLLNQGAGAIGSGLSGIGSGVSNWWNGLNFAEGGPVKSYAQGGVTSEDNVRSIANFLPTEQLPKSFQMAQGRGDFNAQDALQQEMAERASLQRGLGGAFNQLPQGAQQNVIRAAGGGVIAFDEGGDVLADNTKRGGKLQEEAARQALDSARQAGALTYTPSTPEEQRASTQAYYNQLESLGGPNPYDPMKESLKARQNAMAENMSQAKGLAALRAMSGMLQPGGAMRGLGNAAGSFADSMEKAQAAEQAEKRAIEAMNFNLADAQRKERMGLTKDAMASTAAAEKNKLDAVNAKRAALQAQGTIQSHVAQALRENKGTGAAKEPKIAEQNYANILADLKATSKPNEGETPAQFNARLARKASELAVAQSKTSDFGPGRAGAAADTLTAAQNRDLSKHMTSFMDSTAYKKAEKAGTADEVYNAEQARKQQELMGGIRPIVIKAKGGIISPIKLD